MFGVVMLLQCNFMQRFEHFAAPKATDVIEFLDLFHNRNTVSFTNNGLL